MLSGSVALSIYTLPRATRDFDFVVHLQQKDIGDLLARFREGYYCDRDAVKEAIMHHSMFNIIDHASGFKADFIILKNEPFRKAEFDRRLEIVFEGMPVNVVSAEDLLLSKIRNYKVLYKLKTSKTFQRKKILIGHTSIVG